MEKWSLIVSVLNVSVACLREILSKISPDRIFRIKTRRSFSDDVCRVIIYMRVSRRLHESSYDVPYLYVRFFKELWTAYITVSDI